MPQFIHFTDLHFTECKLNVFGANYVRSNEDRRLLSAAKNVPMEVFWFLTKRFLWMLRGFSGEVALYNMQVVVESGN